ncbi:MAG: thiamine diphosphokinase [Lachnospiraceae bacterium]|nr:thiamine diphosphokinase [Lachnospiraceae bacterium]
MEKMAGKCIIIGAGDLTMGEIAAGEQDYIIAVDGGLSYVGILGVEPDIIIGDFDSVSEQEREAIKSLKEQIPERIIQLPVEKDDTDMLAALKHGLSLGYQDFRIYAGTGGRFDHTLANIQCLLYLKKHGATGYLVDGTGMILVLQNEAVHFQKNLEGYLSLFSLGKEARGVAIEGMKYTLTDYTITNDFPIGISNEFIGEEAVISVEDGELVCMIQYCMD